MALWQALTFLQKAAGANGVITDPVAHKLVVAFRDGKVAMVFGGTEAGAELKQALGADKLAVAEPLISVMPGRVADMHRCWIPRICSSNANSSGGVVLDFLSFLSQASTQRPLADCRVDPCELECQDR